jgi:protein TonB
MSARLSSIIAAGASFTVASALAQNAALPEQPNRQVAQEAPGSVRGSAEFEKRAWAQEVLLHLLKYKRYPAGRPVPGEVWTRFVLDRAGQVVSAEVVKSSGHDILDEAALEWLRRASPLPRPPAIAEESDLTITWPVKFAPVSPNGRSQ